MTLHSLMLGEIEYEAEDIFSFPAGIPSFEQERQFLILPIESPGNPFFCLQSVTDPNLSFLMMDPFSLDPSYTPVLQPSELKNLGVTSQEELCYYVLCAMKRPAPTSTVNLMGPICIEPEKRVGYQIIMQDTPYQIRHSLSEFFHSGGDSSC